MSELSRSYRNLVVWGPFTDLGPADVPQLEFDLGRVLPDEFAAFLRATHGASLPYAVQLPPGDADAELLSFDYLHTVDELLRQWREYPSTIFAQELGDDLLPVASDPGGSVLLLDLREQTHGQVWSYVHGLPEWAGGDNQDRGGLVAQNWDDYLSMLIIEEDYAADVWSDVRNDPDEDWKAAVVAWLDAGLPDWRNRDWA